MADGDSTPAGVDGVDKFAEPGPYQIDDGDISTSPAALKVLHEQGVDAWRQWVAEQGGGSRADVGAQ